MMEKGDIHWTDEEELLSKFVLHQLSAVEAEKLAAHVNTCDKCRQAVREETLLVAGVKSAGRTEMKERLWSHLATTGTRTFQIPWTRVASLAAMVVILLAVGVYNNWFSTNFPGKPSTPDQVVQEEARPPVESAVKGKKEPSPQIADARKLSQSTHSTERDRPDRSKDNGREQGKQELKKDEAYNYQLMAKSAEGSRVSEESGIADEALKLGDGNETAGQVIASPSQAFWVEGHVTSSETGQRQSLGEAPRTQQEMRSFTRAEIKSKTMKDSKLSSTPSVQGMSLQVFLNQKLSSSLPQTLQNKQNQTGTVQTLIENRNNDIQMTLYLDSLLPEAELQSAQVESFNSDSIVLNLPNQRISYKLPPGLQGKVNTKAGEVK